MIAVDTWRMSTLFRADRWRPLPEKCVKRRGQRLFTASFCQFNLYYVYYAGQSAITHCNSLCRLSISLQTVVIILVYRSCNAYNEPWDPGGRLNPFSLVLACTIIYYGNLQCVLGPLDYPRDPGDTLTE